MATVTAPVVPTAGVRTEIEVPDLITTAVAGIPPKVTVSFPTNPAPVMTTVEFPIVKPVDGETDVTFGGVGKAIEISCVVEVRPLAA